MWEKKKEVHILCVDLVVLQQWNGHHLFRIGEILKVQIFWNADIWSKYISVGRSLDKAVPKILVCIIDTQHLNIPLSIAVSDLHIFMFLWFGIDWLFVFLHAVVIHGITRDIQPRRYPSRIISWRGIRPDHTGSIRDIIIRKKIFFVFVFVFLSLKAHKLNSPSINYDNRSKLAICKAASRHCTHHCRVNDIQMWCYQIMSSSM